MSHSNLLDQGTAHSEAPAQTQRRKVVNTAWQPFLQFKLLMLMLGSTVLVALILGALLYYTFSDILSTVPSQVGTTSYYGEMIEAQLVHLFRYCGALFVLYMLLLAAVCVAYTHRLVGPLRPFTRHVEALCNGHYESRVILRKNDLDIYIEHASKLNELAAHLASAKQQR